MSSAPPTIFSTTRRIAARRRIPQLQRRTNAARFVVEDIVSDMLERLAFLRHGPKQALVVGDWTGELARCLRQQRAEVHEADAADGFDEEQPFAAGSFDFVASVSSLDTVNDLPGALIHIRKALAPGGRAIASFVGAGSLPALRQIMLRADGDRPAARLHPQVDVRAGAQLLQRAGWADPVADSRTLAVSYRSLEQLAADLRAQGLGNVLASRTPPLGKAGLERARAAFTAAMDERGRVVETFEIVTLSGRHPSKNPD
ncbi:methyltransferase domain-containing protein [Altererythrobacter sp. Root672]|uniref:methyltransferase domain-containing protein n=1 Tax=Altererythrobacter sp. Root672 TaxID=1736584 RepID=UPI0006FE99C2|nr:methyltransferase domain-containing protein [Altererythrobacter sp. Root672]KRA84606.1 methyltransferase [Altererythrobacter sp. Root672]